MSGDCAFVGGYVGLQLVNVSDPADPVEAGLYATTESFGLAVAGDHAYLGTYGALQVVDVSDPADPIRAGATGLHMTGWAVAVSGNIAHVAAGGDGFNLVDVSDLTKPAGAGSYDNEKFADPLLDSTKPAASRMRGVNGGPSSFEE